MQVSYLSKPIFPPVEWIMTVTYFIVDIVEKIMHIKPTNHAIMYASSVHGSKHVARINASLTTVL